MGVQCEINLNKHENGTYLPGSVVSGIIKYVFDEETSIKKITVSLKGSGYLQIRNKLRRDKHFNSDNEIYVDNDHIIQEDQKVYPIGVYETKFSFLLPLNAPPSLYFCQLLPIYNIRCAIDYYVRIKFERSGFFTPNNHFRKDITVASGIVPHLPTSAIDDKQNHVIRLTSRSDDVVKVEGNVETCFITPGGKIELNYDVTNDSNVVVHGIEFILVETYIFKFMNHFGANAVKVQENVVNTEAKMSSVDIGQTQNMFIVINVPKEKTTIENSNMVSRDYSVKMTILLPPPHLSSTVEIPVKIGDQLNSASPADDHANASASAQYCPSAPPAENGSNEPPPSYWEVMGEHKKDDKNKNFE